MVSSKANLQRVIRAIVGMTYLKQQAIGMLCFQLHLQAVSLLFVEMAFQCNLFALLLRLLKVSLRTQAYILSSINLSHIICHLCAREIRAIMAQLSVGTSCQCKEQLKR